MTARERFVGVMTYANPDRIPFVPGWPRESTLAAWRKQGLAADANWLGRLVELLGIDPAAVERAEGLGGDFRMIPQFEEKVLEHASGHYVVQDWKGNVCEIADNFDVTYLRQAKDFVTRRWIRCPVETRDDWERMKPRYRLDAPGRFPADLPEAAARRDESRPGAPSGQSPPARDRVLRVSFNGPFWQMREWCGFEGLCLMTLEQPDLVAEMAGFWTEFVAAMLDRLLHGGVPDHVIISEDMAYKQHAMISPAMTRRFCQPSYVRWAGQLRSAGVPVIDVDSDGYVGELIPIWIESGIHATNPMEVAAGNDINVFRAQFGRRIAYSGGVDKRAMAAGGRVLREELKRIEPAVRGGGYIPSCDHGVPSDVSWPNFVDYARLLAQMTGWL